MGKKNETKRLFIHSNLVFDFKTTKAFNFRSAKIFCRDKVIISQLT